jgi:multidrug resistance efflux pump
MSTSQLAPQLPDTPKQPDRTKTIPAKVVTLIALGFGAIGLILFWSRNAGSVLSVDAMVNARIIDIKAPEDGIVEDFDLKTNAAVQSRQLLFRIKNQHYSALPVQIQAVKSRLNQLNAERQEVEKRLSIKQDQIQVVVSEGQAQQAVKAQESQYLQEKLAQEKTQLTREESGLMADIAIAQQRYGLAQQNLERIEEVAQAKGVSEKLLSDFKDAVAQRQSELNRLTTQKATLRAQQASLPTSQNATTARNQLARTPSNYDPNIRLQELRAQRAQDEQAIVTLNQRIQDADKELAEFTKMQRASPNQQDILVPVKQGIIWNLTTSPGRVVKSGDLLGQVADCQQRWVDAWVKEADVHLIDQSRPPESEWAGDAPPPRLGKVTVIRAGIGRLAIGSDVPVAIDPTQPHRYAQVRVEVLVDAASNHTASCDISRTGGKVTFYKLSNNGLQKMLNQIKWPFSRST